MHAVDLAVIVIYLVAMPALGVWFGRRQRSASDYFIGDRSLPWWAVCFSVVATETSTLTVISTPGLVFGNGFLFLQLALGYIVGRTVAAFVLLPRYFRSDLPGGALSAYDFLGKRFGATLQSTASVTFLITRLLAEGVRLFAGAIPIKVIADHYHLHISYWQIVVVLTMLTLIYAGIGGLRAVVWVDVIQLSTYLLGAVAAVIVLAGKLPDGWFAQAAEAGRFTLTDFGANMVTSPYAFGTAVLGGALLSMASHGADQLIVQRLLACRGLRDAQRALIGSGIVVFIQFTLFLLVGAMLWAYYGGHSVKELGMASADDVFPRFIVETLPVGVSGLLIAGVLASTMGALASALNALSVSTVADLYLRLRRRPVPDRLLLRYGRLATLIWAGVFAVFASLFSTRQNSVIELGLGITGYTYGALLGAFLLGLLIRRARQPDAVIAFLVTVATMAVVILLVRFPGPAGKPLPLAYPWYTPLGVLITLLVGGLLSLRRNGSAAGQDEPEVAVSARS